MKNESPKYYWYCPKCGNIATYTEVSDMKKAISEMENHEAEVHKKSLMCVAGKSWSEMPNEN